MVQSTQESTTLLLPEPQIVWSHCNQKPNILSSGKHWSSTLGKTSEPVNQSMSRNLVASPTISRLSSLKSPLDNPALNRTFSLKEWRERIFIIWSQYLLLIHASNTTLLDITVKKRFLLPFLSIPSIKRDSEPFMPTQSQWPPEHAWALMSLPMLSTPFSWQFRTLSSTTKTLTSPSVSVTLDSFLETSRSLSCQSWADQLEMLLSRRKWSDKSPQCQPSGEHLTGNLGPTLPWAIWSRSQMPRWQEHLMRRQQHSRLCQLILAHPEGSTIKHE